MRKIISYIAISLNGKIADANGKVDWLEEIPNPDISDYGYSGFIKMVDTTIMGCTTYKQLISWDIKFPYKDKKNFVITGKKDLGEAEFVEFISENHLAFFKKLKEEEGRNIWLIGGGKVNTLFLNAGLLDELKVFIMPVIISGGPELFHHLPQKTGLKLVDSKTYSNGVVELSYVVG